MRLHLNENTAGCSPAVLDAILRLGRREAAFYPDYDTAYEAVSRFFGVPVDHLLLTNGLDEGILAAAVAACRDHSMGLPEAVGVVPAFDEYEICTTAAGGRMVTVPLGDDLDLSDGDLLSVLTARTRIVFLSNPHNPSGRAIALDTLRDLAREVTPAILFVDEAYADFSGETLIHPDTFERFSNVVVGRTFSKAYGLAGLRVGVLVGSPLTLAPMRRVVPPYSVNAWAAAALPVAIEDRDYRDWYLGEAAASRALLALACERLELRTWPSAANFVLIGVDDAARVVRELAARGVRVRDRSGDPGSGQCIRMTAGLVEDTRRAIVALEEVVCAAR
jgi:histidinol-phosphate aminotransferase